MPILSCPFCDEHLNRATGLKSSYEVYASCVRCGEYRLTKECLEDFKGERFSLEQKNILSIFLRNEYEKRNHSPVDKVLTLDDLRNIIKQYIPLDPLAKIDNALINLGKESKIVGFKSQAIPADDYPYYHCSDSLEFINILNFLKKVELIDALDDFDFPHTPCRAYITAKGYERLREIINPGMNSNQCFVAMWFSPEMDKVYEDAIKPAIEFKEREESNPRFKAVRIDNLEYSNDINDETIAQIRRSRFMVCDLTGYRGGVYFEAGFAYGLGLEVIYTCRDDWCKEQVLKNTTNKKVSYLFDDKKRKISVKKEGVHFDLAHRNRIEWSPDNLKDFRIKLENRIKAVII